MDLLQTLGYALGLAALAGINLYLTVFAASLALHFGWVALPAQVHELSLLGDPWIIGVSGALYLLEFFADKIPWIDTANDAVHTFIRPIGGALLAVLALGEANPTVKVIAALLAGGVALTSHAAKTSSRLVANTSPEPVSNIALSVGEDAIVMGGLGLLIWQPVIALVVVLLALGVIWIFLPRLLRSMSAIVWLAWRKLNGPAAGHELDIPMSKIPANCELALRRAHATTDRITFAAPCLSGGGPLVAKNRRGWLVHFSGGGLFFISPRWHGCLVVEIPPAQTTPARESRFLCERLALSGSEGGTHVFLFERGHHLLADFVARELGTTERSEDQPEPVVVRG